MTLLIDNAELKEAVRTLSSLRRSLSVAFNKTFKLVSSNGNIHSSYFYVEDVTLNADNSGTLIVDKKGELWQVGFTENSDGTITFDNADSWVHVYRTYMPFESSATDNEPEESTESVESEESSNEQDIEESLVEMDLSNITLVESEDDSLPLVIEVGVIKPGWGNTRDNNYYSKAMLKRDSHHFEGLKMYATDHRQSEKSVLTEVSQILECPVRFDEFGRPIARVGILNAEFEEMIRRRDKLGILNDLHCSIIASGVTKAGFTEGGRTGKQVTRITKGISVDWVTQAGAGGSAIALAESAVLMENNMSKNNDVERVEETVVLESDEKVTTLSESDVTEEVKEVKAEVEALEVSGTLEVVEETFLEADEVSGILESSPLPDTSRQRLSEGSYHNTHEVESAIYREMQYVASLTNSGNPPSGLSSSEFGERSPEVAVEESKKELIEVNKRRDSVNDKFLS